MSMRDQLVDSVEELDTIVRDMQDAGTDICCMVCMKVYRDAVQMLNDARLSLARHDRMVADEALALDEHQRGYHPRYVDGCAECDRDSYYEARARADAEAHGELT